MPMIIMRVGKELSENMVRRDVVGSRLGCGENANGGCQE